MNKEYFIDLIENGKVSKLQKLYFNLCTLNKCIYCGTKYPDGIILKLPETAKSSNVHEWFTAEYLVHLQTTHGYSPDIVQMFIDETTKE